MALDNIDALDECEDQLVKNAENAKSDILEYETLDEYLSQIAKYNKQEEEALNILIKAKKAEQELEQKDTKEKALEKEKEEMGEQWLPEHLRTKSQEKSSQTKKSKSSKKSKKKSKNGKKK